jgi:myo-inositol-1(or 4)-monophosphatase
VSEGPHPALVAATAAAEAAYHHATTTRTGEQLADLLGDGADGTPTMVLDALVEEAVLDAVAPFGINVLSEECGLVDRGSAVTLVVDPVDGTANAVAGVPLTCFLATIALDGVFTESVTTWFATGERAYVGPYQRTGWASSGRKALDGAAVSMLRPQLRNESRWLAVARRTSRVRVLGCSGLESLFVARGLVDAFADAGSDTHRLVDLAAAMAATSIAGTTVVDVWGRPVELDADLTRRWSGIVAASAPLAEELAEVIRSAAI